MSREYHGTTVSFNGDVYTVELWDGAANVGTGSTEINLAGEGFELTYNGEGDTTYENPLRSSSCKAFFLIENGIDDTYFKDIATQAENIYALQILKNGALFWVGRVLADQMRFVRGAYEGKYVCEVSAVDALELISGYDITSSFFSSGYTTPIEFIADALALTGLDDYYVSTYVNSNSEMYWDCVEHTNTNMSLTLASPLSRMRLREYSFIEDYDPFNNTRAFNYKDCKSGIEQILLSLGARMMLRNGRYVIFQPISYDAATFNYKIYDAAGAATGTLTAFTHAHTLDLAARKQWEAKPVLSYQKPVRQVDIGVIRENVRFDKKTTFNTNTLDLITTDLNDTLPIRFGITVQTESTTTNYTWIEIRYGYYALVSGIAYHWDGANWVNHGLGTSYYIYSPGLIPSFTNQVPEDYQILVELPVLPTGCTEFGVRVDAVNAQVFPSGTTALDFTSTISIQQPYTATSPIEWEQRNQFTATNNGGVGRDSNSTLIELMSTYHSGTPSDVNGVQVFNGSNWVQPSTWSVGWSSNVGDLPYILAELICGYYINFVPSIRGNWIDNGEYEPLKSLSFDSYTWIFNAGTFSPRQDRWEGEWIGLIADYSLVSNDGEGQRVWGREDDNVYDRIKRLENTVSRHEGAFSKAVDLSGSVTSTTTITALFGNIVLLADTTGGAITINLATAVDNYSVVTIKKISGDASNITIAANGSETIDGAATKIINNQYQSITFAPSAGNWYEISKI